MYTPKGGKGYKAVRRDCRTADWSAVAAAAAERNDLKRRAAVVRDIHRTLPDARFAGTHETAFAEDFDATVGKDALERVAAHVGDVDAAGGIHAHSVGRDRNAARMEEFLALDDAAVGAGREPPDASVAVVAGVDESLGVDRDAVEASADLGIARDVGEHALRIGGRVADLDVAVGRGEHVESAGRGSVSALDVIEERLREVELAVQILDAVRVVEAIRHDIVPVDFVVLERDAQEASFGVLLVVAYIEFAFGTEADAHRRRIAALFAGRHVEPLHRNAAGLVEAEYGSGLRAVVVRGRDHEAVFGVDAHSVGRGARRRHLDCLCACGESCEACESGKLFHLCNSFVSILFRE